MGRPRRSRLSPQLELPAHERRLLLCDAFHVSFRILAACHAELHPCCQKCDDDAAALLSAVRSAWGFVDVAHRLRQLIQSSPIPRKSNAVAAFLADTAPVTQFRHHIQHIDERIRVKPRGPIWGAISWAMPGDALAFAATFIGQPLPGMRVPGLVLDSHEMRFVSRTALSLGDASLNFDILAESARHCELFVRGWFVEQGIAPPAIAETAAAGTM